MQGCVMRCQTQEYDAWLNIYIEKISLGSKYLGIINMTAFGTNIFIYIYMKSNEW